MAHLLNAGVRPLVWDPSFGSLLIQVRQDTLGVAKYDPNIWSEWGADGAVDATVNYIANQIANAPGSRIFGFTDDVEHDAGRNWREEKKQANNQRKFDDYSQRAVVPSYGVLQQALNRVYPSWTLSRACVYNLLMWEEAEGTVDYDALPFVYQMSSLWTGSFFGNTVVYPAQNHVNAIQRVVDGLHDRWPNEIDCAIQLRPYDRSGDDRTPLDPHLWRDMCATAISVPEVTHLAVWYNGDHFAKEQQAAWLSIAAAVIGEQDA